MRKYNSYKDSKTDAFSDIPVDWKVIRMKHLVDSSKYYQIGDGDHGSIKPEMYLFDSGIPYIRVQNLTWNGKLDFNGMVYISDEVQEKNLKSKLIPNDILIAKTGATIGKLAIIPDEIEQANTTSSVGKITVNQSRFNSKYVLFAMMSRQFTDQIWIEASQKSAQPGFNVDDLVLFQIAIPKTLEEQIAIADYLDRKTAEIDELIADKKRLLELYEEEKSTIINQAVTKGINPDAPMKDSGVEWLGEIPEHWDLKKIGYCGKIVRGGSPRPTGDPRYFFGDYIHWITVKEVTNAVGKYVVDTEEYLTEEGSKNSRIIEPETLLLSNSGATLGVPKISKIRGCINDGSVAFPELKSFLNRDYLYYFFVSHTDIYREQMAGNGQPNLNTEIIKSTFIPVPSTIEEQTAIVEFIEIETLKVDAKKAKTEKLIELLTEYRTALISEVVTGKIKVTE